MRNARHPSRFRRNCGYHEDLFGILIVVIVLIVYGSLYPWVFEVRHLSASPFYILLHSWSANPQDRRFLFDVAVNIAAYIPLGMSAYLAIRRFRSSTLAVLSPVVLGALLSASVEMVQLFTPHRVCSAVDLVSNISGSASGVLAGFALTQITDIPVAGLGFQFRDRSAVALLFCWVSFLLFPLFPDLLLNDWKTKFAALIQAPLISPVPILLNAAEWFAVGQLLLVTGARSPFRWLLALLLLVPIQFGIINHSPLPADFAGAFLAVLLFHFFGKGPSSDRLAGITLLLGLTLSGLAPFHFADPPQAFLWIPFGGFLDGQWQDAISTLLGKLFRYGGSIWLLHRGGLGTRRATAFVAVVLAGIEVLQTRIPGHVAEVTDPLLAVLLCLGFLALEAGLQASTIASPPVSARLTRSESG